MVLWWGLYICVVAVCGPYLVLGGVVGGGVV